jgi:transposase-like protein
VEARNAEEALEILASQKTFLMKPVSEAEKTRIVDLYVASKLRVECIAKLFDRDHELIYTILVEKGVITTTFCIKSPSELLKSYLIAKKSKAELL